MAKEKVNTSIANRAMLRFAEEYARQHGYLEGWVKLDDFWANKVDRILHPDKPQVIEVSYVAPVFEEDRENKGHWGIPRVKIDNYWGNPRINVVDPEENFCCLAFDRETNLFTEAQVWRKDGFKLAEYVKGRIELYIQMMKDGYDMKME